MLNPTERLLDHLIADHKSKEMIINQADTSTMPDPNPIANPTPNPTISPQTNATRTKPQTTFLSLPHELRQQILIDSYDPLNCRRRLKKEGSIITWVGCLRKAHVDIREDMSYVAKEWEVQWKQAERAWTKKKLDDLVKKKRRLWDHGIRGWI